MRNDKYAKAPLLYIHNGQANDVKANMQHNYISKKQKQLKSQESEKVYEGKANKKRGKSFYELSEEQFEQEEAEETEESKEKQTEAVKEAEKKPFTEMTIPEKLVYLTNKPDYAPKVSCIIRTTERSYRGLILEYKDNKVKIRSGRRNVEVLEKDIKNIRIIGL